MKWFPKGKVKGSSLWISENQGRVGFKPVKHRAWIQQWMDLFNAMRKAILTLTMILVKNDSELGEFIFFQQTICCAFACNNLFLKDTWYMSWGRIWPITKTFGKLLSYGNSWVARLSKNRQNVIHYPELAMKTWKVWSHPTTMTEMVQPSGKLRARWTPFSPFLGQLLGGRVWCKRKQCCIRKTALNETTAWKTFQKTSISRFFASQKPQKSHGTLSCLAWHDQILRLNRWGTIFPQRDIQIHDNF